MACLKKADGAKKKHGKFCLFGKTCLNRRVGCEKYIKKISKLKS